jgi:hypothetical protein
MPSTSPILRATDVVSPPGTFGVRAGRNGRALLFCASCRDREKRADAVARATGQECQLRWYLDGDTAAARDEHRRERALALWRGSGYAIGSLAYCYLATPSSRAGADRVLLRVSLLVPR